ncbi:MAG: preprotein translocase subunit YajC [Limisphaerales bacterium]
MFSHVLNTLTPLLAQAQPMAPNPTGEMVKMVGMIALFGVMMYLLMIRPQQKKAKEHDTLMKGLRPGDKVVIPANTRHSKRAEGPDPCICICANQVY